MNETNYTVGEIVEFDFMDLTFGERIAGSAEVTKTDACSTKNTLEMKVSTVELGTIKIGEWLYFDKEKDGTYLLKETFDEKDS